MNRNSWNILDANCSHLGPNWFVQFNSDHGRHGADKVAHDARNVGNGHVLVRPRQRNLLLTGWVPKEAKRKVATCFKGSQPVLHVQLFYPVIIQHVRQN